MIATVFLDIIIIIITIITSPVLLLKMSEYYFIVKGPDLGQSVGDKYALYLCVNLEILPVRSVLEQPDTFWILTETRRTTAMPIAATTLAELLLKRFKPERET